MGWAYPQIGSRFLFSVGWIGLGHKNGHMHNFELQYQFLTPGGINHFGALPLFSLTLSPSPSHRSRNLRSRLSYTQLEGLQERCKLSRWGLEQSHSRQRFWWHLKCALFYAHDLSFRALSCLNKAHRICVYFVSQKKLSQPFRRLPLLAPGGMPPSPLPAPLCTNVLLW